jgi:hypothetical protein
MTEKFDTLNGTDLTGPQYQDVEQSFLKKISYKYRGAVALGGNFSLSLFIPVVICRCGVTVIDVNIGKPANIFKNFRTKSNGPQWDNQGPRGR